MRGNRRVLWFLLISALLLPITVSASPQNASVATPVIRQTPALGGAVLISIWDNAADATVYYTLDGSTPTAASQVYEGPLLVTTMVTVKALATAEGMGNSAVATQMFMPHVANGTLVWSDEFNSAEDAPESPDPNVWTYDVGANCCGNHELETYCAWGSTAPPCDLLTPNAFVADGKLHVVARRPAAKVYTSARLKSEGKFSFLYGRIEARMKLPEGQGMWPAFWLLGNSIAKVRWPACGELDIMEHIDGSNPPFSAGKAPAGFDWIAGSVHFGPNGAAEINGTEKYHPAGFSAADWHTYGMIWKKGIIQFYVDDPAHPYVTFHATDPQFARGKWPFDDGPEFLLLNLAVGGDWPGSPDATTVFPSEMLVDYVRIYTE